MEALLQNNEDVVLFVGMVSALVLAAILEALIPRQPERADINRRWANNIGLTALNQVNITFFSGAVALVLAWWGGEEKIGLLRQVDLGLVPSLLLAILVFEFVAYWFHRALHTIPWLWRIHAVHHCDTELDFTTTYRNHPLELYVNAPLTIPVILVFGFPVVTVLLYQLLKTSISVLAHSNLRLSPAADRILRLALVTPNFHRLHHCSERRFTDSNYSAAFPVFDYLFGTARNRPYAEHATMAIGLDSFRAPRDGRLDRLLLMPFVWRPVPARDASIQPEAA
ncbi:MAG: sterol desaturase family protein [Gallionellaceae bacterium]|nr:sterol desaturase family protein [Gallionellaceae bacterium]